MNLENIPRQLQLTGVNVHLSVVDKGASSSHDRITRSMQGAMSPSAFGIENGAYDSAIYVPSSNLCAVRL